MHELSIARALLGRVELHATADQTVLSVRVRIGPMKAVEPQSLLLAWRAATDGTRFDGTRLDFELLPWRMHCPVCGRTWEGGDWCEPCGCGCQQVQVDGSDDLVLLSITCDESPHQREPDESTHDREERQS